jgi:Uma2 family endonuclease
VERCYTLDDYFGIEEMSEIKHEYYDGEIFVMVGESFNHNRITINLASSLNAALRDQPCEAFTRDMRVTTPSGLYTYPDVMVVCGVVEMIADRPDTLTNPTVIIEVLSESTKKYDRGQKFTLYESIETLRDYILIEQDRIHIDHFHLLSDDASDQWVKRSRTKLEESLELPSIQFQIPLSEIYRRVDFAS